jgi:Alpha/beta hydrolase domain
MRRPGILALLFFATAAVVQARVTHVDIQSRKDIWDGRYELITGRVYFALDPKNAHDSAVVDLDKAPRNAQGEVELSSDLYVMRPKAGGNGVMFFEVSNRGGTSLLHNGEPSETFLLERGYTLAWIGWQFDVLAAPGRVRLYAPLATGVSGDVRSDFVVSAKTDEFTVAHFIQGSIGGTGYPVADLAAPGAMLTMREAQDAPRRAIPRKQWHFVTPTTLHLEGGLLPGEIYEVVYPAKDPAVVGTGLAAVRDFVSYCKHDEKSIAPVKVAYGFGISQSGRFLRHLVWQGFNADEQGRQVFDGILVHVAGAGVGNFNHRFAQPSRDAEPLTPAQYPVDHFPFTDLPETDPNTHVTAGLLDRATAEHVVPKIFYTNTEYEYWSRGESLTHTTPDGKQDAQIPPTSRIYFIPGLAHVGGPWPPALGGGESHGTQLRNPNHYWDVTHGLIDAMDAWVRRGVEPPDSRIPRISDGTLVPRSDAPVKPYAPYVVDYGPGFAHGIVREPPHVTGTYPVLLPKTDKDGNALAGVRHPFVDVPTATYTGWNPRDSSIGFGGVRVAFTGSYIPWPKEKVTARYATRAQYLGAFTEAALRMMKERFLTAEDLPDLLREGVDRWEYATKE